MFSMYAAVILSFVVVTVTAEFDKEICTSYSYSEINCCMNEYPGRMVDVPYDMSECLATKKTMCEKQLCRAKGMGLTDDDDKLDRSKVLEVMFKKIADDPSLLEEVKTKCIDGDIKRYEAIGACEGEIVSRCITTQWLKRCQNWNDSSTCQQFKEFVKEC
nr:uncharacterized protein LOC110373350 [Helicoverpa armigera]